MNEARKLNRLSNSNPHSVLRSIGAQQGVIESDLLAPFGAPVSEEPSTSTTTTSETEVRVQLYRGEQLHQEDTSTDVMQHALDSALQIQQLAERLRANEESLLQRETDFENKVCQWNQSVRDQQAELENRLGHLEQNASQVRCQQLHLMQLQTDIVKSYEATKVVIESLATDPMSDVKTIVSLKQLKHEIGGRFDYISRRWSHLAKLMQQGRDEDTGERGVNDSIDWTV